MNTNVARARRRFLDQLHTLVDYWARPPASERSLKDVLNGLVHSILCELDGCGTLPGYKLQVLSNGAVRVDDLHGGEYLHERWYNEKTTEGE